MHHAPYTMHHGDDGDSTDNHCRGKIWIAEQSNIDVHEMLTLARVPGGFEKDKFDIDYILRWRERISDALMIDLIRSDIVRWGLTDQSKFDDIEELLILARLENRL